LAIFDSFDRGLSSYAEENNVFYMEIKEQITTWLLKVEDLLSAREGEYLERIQDDNEPVDFLPIILVVDGYSRIAQMLDNTLQEKIAKLMKNYSYLGFHLLVSGSNNDLSKGYDSLTAEIKQVRQAVILMKKSEQTLFTLSYERKEEEIQPGFGYYVMNGKEVKIQIPLCTTERKVLA
jgi:DNA segregation ATPase FtsK/SpoIIIE, S-DNA-T family